jgi:hypothetical protein
LAWHLLGLHATAEDTKELTVFATEPPPVEPSKDAHIPPAAPESADNENTDPKSALQRRKMKSALD